ncbi:uncharacterized protein LOC111592372 [Drosophila hydei]|uniref:Uncharacterized protein LOC111592372 n=1 Tax=Drosophila hydei TaxID=7224 RepID=A0A6J1L803_DROHY|nr:uncharacterized protein LOC111592372 [Drosophila hydei]XP_023160308.2 uncharacterized protein LOC111592372 [Drosophila hydei]XP_023160309.2 uncharacterized protein LOC111592372 [Drosophila hydei]
MTQNPPDIELEAMPSTFIALPFNPTLEWHIHGLYENLGTQAESLDHNEDSISIQNYDVGDFVTLIEVDSETQRNINKSMSNSIWEPPASPGNCLGKLACTIDILDITRRLLTTAVENCNPGVKLDENLMYPMAQKLSQAIVSPLEESGEGIDSVIFSLVPAIAVQRDTGRVIAYAVGQLVARGSSNAQMIMVVRGCALSVQSRQIIIESISQSLLPVSESSI